MPENFMTTMSAQMYHKERVEAIMLQYEFTDIRVIVSQGAIEWMFHHGALTQDKRLAFLRSVQALSGVTITEQTMVPRATFLGSDDRFERLNYKFSKRKT